MFIIIFVSIDAIYQTRYNVDLFGIKREHGFRISGIFRDEYKLGSFISRLLPLLLGLLIYIKMNNNIKIFLFLFVISLSLIGIAVSGERTSLVIFILTFSYIYVFSKVFRKKTTFAIIISIFALFLIVYKI